MIDTLPKYKAFCRLLADNKVTNSETQSAQFLTMLADPENKNLPLWLLDIVKLDEHLAKQFSDYKQNEESMNSFFNRKFGSEFNSKFNELAIQ